jgi:hypothetical protein
MFEFVAPGAVVKCTVVLWVERSVVESLSKYRDKLIANIASSFKYGISIVPNCVMLTVDGKPTVAELWGMFGRVKRG